MRFGILVAMLLGLAAPARAEWQLKPFAGVKFGGGTNLVADLDGAGGKRKQVIGVTTVLMGNIFGGEVDLGLMPGYFDNGFTNVFNSSLTSLTGNVLIGLPRRMTEYTLRPYFVGGFGLLRARTATSVPRVLDISRTLPAFDAGVGVTGFLNRTVGVSWEVRHFRKLQRGEAETGSTGDGLGERLSFWRANMALAIRL